MVQAFTFTQTDPRAGLNPDRSRHTVLLVDDDELMRGVLGEVLADNGFAVLAAASARQAMAILNRGAAVDIVFSDLKGPGMNGAALAHWIAHTRPGLAVVLAGVRHGHMAPLPHQAEFLRKPCDFDQIVTCIRAAITRH